MITIHKSEYCPIMWLFEIVQKVNGTTDSI